MVLDPETSENWIRNSDGEWQRNGAAARYLSEIGSCENGDTEIAEGSATYDCEDDFM